MYITELGWSTSPGQAATINPYGAPERLRPAYIARDGGDAGSLGLRDRGDPRLLVGHAGARPGVPRGLVRHQPAARDGIGIAVRRRGRVHGGGPLRVVGRGGGDGLWRLTPCEDDAGSRRCAGMAPHHLCSAQRMVRAHIDGQPSAGVGSDAATNRSASCSYTRPMLWRRLTPLFACALVCCALAAPAANALKAQVPGNFVGVVAGPPLVPTSVSPGTLAQQLTGMARSGVQSVRFALYWGAIQPYATINDVPADQRAQYSSDGVDSVPTNWVPLDTLVGDAASRGLSLLPSVLAAPAWDGKGPPGANTLIPQRTGPYANFLKALVLRYGSARLVLADPSPEAGDPLLADLERAERDEPVADPAVRQGLRGAAARGPPGDQAGRSERQGRARRLPERARVHLVGLPRIRSTRSRAPAGCSTSPPCIRTPSSRRA